MTCPICDQKAANCDCTPAERSMHDEMEELNEQVEALTKEAREYRDRAVQAETKIESLLAAVERCRDAGGVFLTLRAIEAFLDE